MILIPFRKIIIDSPLSPEEVIKRISATVSPRQPWFRSLAGKAEFVGNVSQEKLQLMPAIKGRNTYEPFIKGQITPTTTGCTLQLTQSLHPIAIIAVLTLFLFATFLGVRAHDKTTLFLLPIFLVFHITMYLTGFCPEVKRTEARLRELTR